MKRFNNEFLYCAHPTVKVLCSKEIKIQLCGIFKELMTNREELMA